MGNWEFKAAFDSMAPSFTAHGANRLTAQSRRRERDLNSLL